MNKKEQKTTTIENIIQLSLLREKLQGADLERLDRVLADLRKSAGETVSKSNAARVLDVSRQALERWTKNGLMPTVKQGSKEVIPRDTLERVAREIDRIKDTGRTRALLANALRDLAGDIDPSSRAKSFERNAAAARAGNPGRGGVAKSTRSGRAASSTSSKTSGGRAAGKTSRASSKSSSRAAGKTSRASSKSSSRSAGKK